ncbi:MAG: hydroxymethylglutaryl-CoA lyase [Thermoanaerobaculales bacterium]|jgi:hydroxymethylglutaryl-CoA lyase|nr:hydroxymethylglutaryl-CoA lyase [Thermoanaerobaculales bacterium]
MNTQDRVTIVEVGPRDGFQVEPEFIPTEIKIEVVNAIARAGVPKIETSSFVHPKAVPQLADAAEVFAGIDRQPGTRYSALVPNLRGVERALEVGADAVRLVVTSTETYNRKNVGMSVDESLAVCRQILSRVDGEPITVEAVIALAFGCPFEGPVSPDRVSELAHRFVDMGVRELSVADSVGLGNPKTVGATMARLQQELPGIAFSLHLHDTRGLGLANVVAALGVGVDTFDASIGGLGGCPIFPDGAGNIATEDLANLCAEMGISTGIDIAAVQAVSRRMQKLLGRRLPSRVLLAGTPGQLYAKIAKESE